MNDRHIPSRNLLDEAIASVRSMPIPDRPPDEFLLECWRHSQSQCVQRVRGFPYVTIRGISPMIRYGVVALALTVVVLFFFVNRSGTVLLAGVIEAVAKHKTARFTVQFIRQDGQSVREEGIATMDGVHQRLERPDGYLITNYSQHKLLHVDRKHKKAIVSVMPVDHPRAFPDILKRYRDDKQTKAVREQLDGRDVLVYRLDKEQGEFRVTIWIDPKTKLPLRLEQELGKPNPPLLASKTVWTDFEWDPQIDDRDKFFSIEPPEGYTVTTLDIRSLIEPDSTKSKTP